MTSRREEEEAGGGREVTEILGHMMFVALRPRGLTFRSRRGETREREDSVFGSASPYTCRTNDLDRFGANFCR